jgi:hypothetical protein
MVKNLVADRAHAQGLYFQFYDFGAYDGEIYDFGAYDGETEHHIMCTFYCLRDGQLNIGQSELVLANQWPAYRAQIERDGWTHRERQHQYPPRGHNGNQSP